VSADKIVADAWRLSRVPILEAAMPARDKGDGYLLFEYPRHDEGRVSS
jgi:hypothetical protein